MNKMLLILIAFLLITPMAVADPVFYNTNQKVFAWDAVTKLTDGSDLPATNVMRYRVWINNKDTDPDKANPVELGTTTDTQYTVTATEEGYFYLGVSALREDANGNVLAVETVTSWSDDIAVVNTDTFGIKYFVPPEQVRGLELPDPL